MRNLSLHVYDEQEVSQLLTELERYLAAFEGLLNRMREIVYD